MLNKIDRSLRKLCGEAGVSGEETNASKAALELLKEYTDEAEVDSFGNVIGFLRSKNENAKTIMLDAHIDQIGMIVTGIDDKGFIRFSRCGGIDLRSVSAQIVTVHGKEEILGVVGSKPPHLEKADEAKKISKIEEMFIDVGMTKEEAEEKISLGDKITINASYIELLNGKVAMTALDDRAGVASILAALEILKGRELPMNVAVCFSGKEETGGQGARVASYRITPDIAIAVDVSFGTAIDVPAEKSGKLGDGVMIGFSPVLTKEICNKLLAVAKEKEIKYQLEAMGGRGTGTNADEIFINKEGVRTGLLSIPQRNMHTPVEIVKLSDVYETARLMAEFILKGDE